jgi:hypothetical protein
MSYDTLVEARTPKAKTDEHRIAKKLQDKYPLTIWLGDEGKSWYDAYSKWDIEVWGADDDDLIPYASIIPKLLSTSKDGDSITPQEFKLMKRFYRHLQESEYSPLIVEVKNRTSGVGASLKSYIQGGYDLFINNDKAKIVGMVEEDYPASKDHIYFVNIFDNDASKGIDWVVKLKEEYFKNKQTDFPDYDENPVFNNNTDRAEAWSDNTYGEHPMKYPPPAFPIAPTTDPNILEKKPRKNEWNYRIPPKLWSEWKNGTEIDETYDEYTPRTPHPKRQVVIQETDYDFEDSRGEIDEERNEYTIVDDRNKQEFDRLKRELGAEGSWKYPSALDAFRNAIMRTPGRTNRRGRNNIGHM